MSTYAHNLAQVNLSMFGLEISSGGGTDGFVRITMPKFYEHVDGQHGDAVHYRTGTRTATFSLTILQNATVNEDLIAQINTARDDTSTNGQGEFLLKYLQDGQTITGQCVLDGYPDEVAFGAEAGSYVYSGRIFDVEMKYEARG